MHWNEAVLAPLAHVQKILSWKQNHPFPLGGGPLYTQTQLKLRMRVQTKPTPKKHLQLQNKNEWNNIVHSVLLEHKHHKLIL